MKHFLRRLTAIMLAFIVSSSMALTGNTDALAGRTEISVQPRTNPFWLTEALVQPSAWERLSQVAGPWNWRIKIMVAHFGVFGLDLEANELCDHIVTILKTYGHPLSTAELVVRVPARWASFRLSIPRFLEGLAETGRIREAPGTSGQGQQKIYEYNPDGPVVGQESAFLQGMIAHGIPQAFQDFLLDRRREDSATVSKPSPQVPDLPPLPPDQLRIILIKLKNRLGLSNAALARELDMPERRVQVAVNETLDKPVLAKSEHVKLEQGLMRILRGRVVQNERLRTLLPYRLPRELLNDVRHPTLDLLAVVLHNAATKRTLPEWSFNDITDPVTTEEWCLLLLENVYEGRHLRPGYVLRLEGDNRFIDRDHPLDPNQAGGVILLVNVAEEIVSEFGISRDRVNMAEPARTKHTRVPRIGRRFPGLILAIGSLLWPDLKYLTRPKSVRVPRVLMASA